MEDRSSVSQPLRIVVKSTDRALFTGQTGSGKTYAAGKLIRSLDRVVVVDPKASESIDKWGLVPWDREAKRILRSNEALRARVLIPIGKDPDEVFEEVFAAVLAAGNCTVYVDELYGVVPPGAKPGPYLTAIWTRGRELGVGAWAATQRPTWVPLFALSEAQHFFVFRLLLDEDRARMSAFMGPEVREPIEDDHGFFYSSPSWRAPIYLPELPVNGRGG